MPSEHYFPMLLPANTINVGETLRYGDYLLSKNGCFNATTAIDGNLVVYRMSTNSILWSTGFTGLVQCINKILFSLGIRILLALASVKQMAEIGRSLKSIYVPLFSCLASKLHWNKPYNAKLKDEQKVVWLHFVSSEKSLYLQFLFGLWALKFCIWNWEHLASNLLIWL